jgi:hypothetical protein
MATDITNKSRSYLVKELNKINTRGSSLKPKNLDLSNDKIKEILLFEEPTKYKITKGKNGGLAKRGYGIARRG